MKKGFTRTLKLVKNKFFLKKNNLVCGFTLLELLVVIAIIGVLAAIVMASLNSSRNKAAASFVKQQADQIKKEFEIYYASNGNRYGAWASNMNTQSPYTSAGFTSVHAGAGHCYVPFGRVDTNITRMVGKAMEKTNIDLTGGSGGGGIGYGFWCRMSPDGQSYAFAFIGMKSGPNVYCVDSSGNIKESNNASSVDPISTHMTNPVTCL